MTGSPGEHEVDPHHDLHVALLYPDIHWNTGNTGRSCLAFGAKLHLVEPLGFSLEDRQVKRAGLDYWPRVSLAVHPNWQAAETELARYGRPWFLSAEGETSLFDAVLTKPAIFVIGSETEGLPAAIREQYRSRLLSIPQRSDSVRSINQSTAAAIAMYEFRRSCMTSG